jgi:hypothetical protein
MSRIALPAAVPVSRGCSVAQGDALPFQLVHDVLQILHGPGEPVDAGDGQRGRIVGADVDGTEMPLAAAITISAHEGQYPALIRMLARCRHLGGWHPVGQEAFMRLLPVLLASVSALGVAAACSPARADWDDNDGWGHHEWHEQQEQRWREHEWREHEWHERQRQSYYAAPPPAYSYAPQGYYVAPPAAYYAPPPPPIYQAPGVSIGFEFGFR